MSLKAFIFWAALIGYGIFHLVAHFLNSLGIQG